VVRPPVSLSGTADVPTGLAWGQSAIIFPGTDVPRLWQCALTGRTVQPQKAEGSAALLAREVLLTLPVALLVAV
jgi:maltooligosyltrehalose synthase